MEPRIVLSTEKLRKQYGDLVAVSDLSLQIPEGGVFGLLGPNGAGKSTVINMICGWIPPTSGRLCLHGQPVRFGDQSVRNKTGICPQQLVLWKKLTCFEQLVHIAEMYGIPSRIARQRAGQLLQDMGLEDKKNHLAGNLSGGMQRKLNLILALMHDPEIIVLDEPDAGLDPQSKILIRDYIRTLAQKRTVILTTHNMDEAERICQYVAIMDHGQLLEMDTTERLKKKNSDLNVLEIELNDEISVNTALALLQRSELKINKVNHHLFLSGNKLFEQLPEMIQLLRNNSVETGEIKFRERSLEDIFIQLTGKRLRE